MWLEAAKGYSFNEAVMPEVIREVLRSGKRIIQPLNCSLELIRQLYIEELAKIEPRFQLDEYCTPVIDDIVSCIHGSNINLPSHKGILIMGGVGSGKTLLMRGLSSLLNKFRVNNEGYNPGFRILPAYSVVEGFSKKGYDIFLEGLLSKTISISDGRVSNNCELIDCNLMIDDIGSENIANHFGITCNIIGELILRRYDGKHQTFATTNLDSKLLNTFYGDRDYSRMKELFNEIHLKGGDRRI
jgi:hypothetical protein